MSVEESDLKLVERVQRGERAAFDLLVLRYQHKVLKLIMRYVHDATEAEDIAQEAFVSHRLLQQAADLRHQNVVIAAQNQGYKKDVQAITSGSANEEEARLNGYAKPNEHTYLVTTPPSPSPTPPASAAPTPSR